MLLIENMTEAKSLKEDRGGKEFRERVIYQNKEKWEDSKSVHLNNGKE